MLKKGFYHVYNYGAHKSNLFLDKEDFERFTTLLYIANDIKIRKVHWNEDDLWSIEKDQNITDIFSYCLTPNSFHLGIVQKTKGGIEKFIQKVCTSYAMYYNNKHKHVGRIFESNYKYEPVSNDDSVRYLIEYIHIKPSGVEDIKSIKYSRLEDKKRLVSIAEKYEYSSFRDYIGINRPQRKLLSFL